MVLVASVFLVNLLCAIVPCDFKFPLPDLSPDPYISKYKYLDHEFGGFWKTFEKRSHFHPKDPIVLTSNGFVEGYFMKVVGGRKIYAFEGIPYAEPPTKHLRFKSPVPKRPWKGVLQAKQYGQVCLQYSITRVFRVIGVEDCLTVNFYTPQIPSEHNPFPKLPVIIFIHGGGFFLGSATVYGPSYFLQKDVILVTLQYRLGVLGFMSSGDHVSPGNYGLKDQALAIKWIHQNIEAFGGDRNRITLMGQSAGSVCVHFQMLSKMARPYFQAAVSLSGSAFNYWTFFTLRETRNFTNVLAKMVGCPTHNSEKLVNCLRRQNPVNLVKKTPRLLDDWPYPSNAFRPSIETVENNPDPFLTELPETLYATNDVANIPWISTTVSGEGYTFLLVPFLTQAFETLRMNWKRYAADYIDLEHLEGINYDFISRKVSKFYFQDIPPVRVPLSIYAKITTDRTFLTGIYKAIQAHSLIASTYSYVFDYNGQYNAIIAAGISPSDWGVGHAEDLFYFFNGSTVYTGFQRDDPEFIISQTMVNLIVNFAAKRKPLYTSDTGEDIKVWSPITSPDNMKFLRIGKAIRMIEDPFVKRIRFWEHINLPDTPNTNFINNLYHSLFSAQNRSFLES